jgi:hypothetical protein
MLALANFAVSEVCQSMDAPVPAAPNEPKQAAGGMVVN